MSASIAILAGGLGTRLQSVAPNVPKILVPVNGRPFVDWLLSYLREKNVGHVVLCVGYLGQRVVDYVGDGATYGLRVEYSFDGENQRGTAGALRNALNLLPNEFMVQYGDTFLPISYKSIFNRFKSSNANCALTVFKNNNKFDRSNIIFENKKIIKYSKSVHMPTMTFIDYGLSFFKKDFFVRNCVEDDLAEFYEKLSDDGVLHGLQVKSRFYEIGNPRGLEETQRYFMMKTSVC